MAAVNVGVGLQDLADLIFIANKKNAPVEVTFGQLDGPKDLFFFLLHLLCKGIVLISGQGSFGTVELDDLPTSVLEHASRKLANIGIHCRVSYETTAVKGPPSVRLVERHQPVLDVSDMCLVLRTRGRKLARITFELRRTLV